jgi:hypothetical protein
LFLFVALFTTDSDSTKKPRPTAPNLGRPQQSAANADVANRSAVPQLNVNQQAADENGELTEKDVLGTMRNRGTRTPDKRNPEAPKKADLNSVNFNDPALAEAYRRQGLVPPRQPAGTTDWNATLAEHQSKPALAPATPVVNTAESLRKSSIVFVRTASTIPGSQTTLSPAVERSKAGLLPQGTVLVARLQHAVSSAAKVPVVAVIEYNYEQNGDLIVPAGSKVYGEMSQATPQGWVGIKFDTLEFPNGEQEKIVGSALSMERGVLKGDVNGKNTGKKFLTRALTGVGTIAAYAVGGRGLGSSSGIDSTVLLRERLASNIALAGEQELAMLAYQQNIVVTVPANTRFYLILHEAGVSQSGRPPETISPVRARGTSLQQIGQREGLSDEDIRDLKKFRDEMRQMNQMLLNSQRALEQQPHIEQER